MLRIFLLALLITTTAARAEECVFVSKEGATLIPAAGEVRIQSADGTLTECTLSGTGTGVPIMSMDCGDGLSHSYFVASSLPNGPDDLVIAINTVWYLDHCNGS